MLKYIFVRAFLLLTTTSFALKPDSVYVATPADYNIPHEELRIKTSDGAQLNTWIYTPDSAKDKDVTIILAYTDMGNMSYYISQAYYLQNKGYRVVTFDYRGFGHSSKFEIDRDNLYYTEFITDLESIIDHTNENYSAGAVGLYGLSMGTFISFSAAINKDIDFLIMDSALTDPAEFVTRLEKTKDVNIILPQLPDGQIKKISSLEIPMLFFSGTEDKITPTEAVRPLVTNHTKSCIMVYNGDHLGAITTMADKYMSYMDVFISTLEL